MVQLHMSWKVVNPAGFVVTILARNSWMVSMLEFSVSSESFPDTVDFLAGNASIATKLRLVMTQPK